ncbi:MAG: lysophospholipid acyltransferase family protein [Polyangiales bacterium]
MPRVSSLVLPLQLAETFRVCAPTVVQGAMGTLTRETCDRRLAEWSANAVRLADIEVEVVGRENVGDAPALVMSNHQSAFDIFTLMHVHPTSLRMIAKKQMFALPIMGGGMKAAGFVSLDRGDRGKALEALEDAKRVMSAGIHVWIAPEGTRSDDGALLPFKKGGFMVALQTGIPIVPVTIDGTRDVLPAKDFRVRKGQKVRITYHPRVNPADYGIEGRDALIDNVRDTICSVLSTHR